MTPPHTHAYTHANTHTLCHCRCHHSPALRCPPPSPGPTQSRPLRSGRSRRGEARCSGGRAGCERCPLPTCTISSAGRFAPPPPPPLPGCCCCCGGGGCCCFRSSPGKIAASRAPSTGFSCANTGSSGCCTGPRRALMVSTLVAMGLAAGAARKGCPPRRRASDPRAAPGGRAGGGCSCAHSPGAPAQSASTPVSSVPPPVPGRGYLRRDTRPPLFHPTPPPAAPIPHPARRGGRPCRPPCLRGVRAAPPRCSVRPGPVRPCPAAAAPASAAVMAEPSRSRCRCRSGRYRPGSGRGAVPGAESPEKSGGRGARPGVEAGFQQVRRSAEASLVLLVLFIVL